VRFFLAAYVVTWIPWFLAVYAGLQKGLQAYATLFNLVGLMGPFAVALFLILTSGGKALKSDFKDRILNLRRIRPTYLTLAIAMPFTVMCLSIWLSLWFGQSTDQFRLAGGANLLAMMILAIILAPLLEEMGLARLWCGQPQGQDRNVEGDAVVRRAVVGVACPADAHRRDLSEPIGEDG